MQLGDDVGEMVRLAAISAELSQITTSLKSKALATHTKIEQNLDSIATTVTTEKLARDVRVTALHKKLDSNAAEIAQDLLSAERSKVANLEAHIDNIRMLHAHQTAVQNRLDTVKSKNTAAMAANIAKTRRHLAENAYTISQVQLMNGPTIRKAQLKKSECTTDSFYGVACEEKLDTQASAAFKTSPPASGKDADQKMDLTNTYY